VTGSLHKLLEERIRDSQFAAEFSRHRDHPELFSELYPLYGAMALDEASERFDAVILDEAQDFRAETLVALADAWTRDVPSSQIVLFGDYSKQAIYGTPKESLEVARSCLAGSIVVPLHRNCRNTRRIAVQTSNLSNFEGLKLHPNQPDGLAVDTRFYKARGDQPERLSQIFSRLKDEGISPADVVVLGKYRLENSGVRLLPSDSPWKLADPSAGPIGKASVAYSSIHAFKGLESAVVVLVDVDSLEEGEGEALLYVAMSRARARLYMLIDQRCRPDFDRKVSAGLLRAMEA
jgi:superfamily I DNA/RNA helicase